jgi:hypothetical protein
MNMVATALHVAVIGAMVAPLTIGMLTGAPRQAAARGDCRNRAAPVSPSCAQLGPRDDAPVKSRLAAGDPPAFLFAAVQPIDPPAAWRPIYHQVERCAGKVGNYDAIRWAVLEAPLVGPNGPTYAFTVGDRIVLARDDTTYLRHEMLHHVLEAAGWQPRRLGPGQHYSIADLHPMPLFGRCTGAR